MPLQRVNRASLWLAAALMILMHCATAKADDAKSSELSDLTNRPLSSHQFFDETKGVRRHLQTVQIRFMLVNANTDKEITSVDLNTNGTFSLANFPTTAFNIAANVTSTEPLRSVVFDIDTKIGYRTDTSVPYALCEESRGNFKSCGSILGAGSHVVKATVIRKNTGNVLASKTINFKCKQRCLCV